MLKNIQALYRTRFDNIDLRNNVWKVLCKSFFQRFIKKTDTVLDIAAGYCEFINDIDAGKKIAIDINPDIKNYAHNDVEYYNVECKKLLDYVECNSIDVVFVSNFFEHLDSREELINIFGDIHKVLKPGGKLLVLQPNIRYVKSAYWDFIDHKIPITDKSIIEIGKMLNFKIVLNMPKFLPYTTKTKIPIHPFFVQIYLMLIPISSFFMGKQSFTVLEK